MNGALVYLAELEKLHPAAGGDESVGVEAAVGPHGELPAAPGVANPEMERRSLEEHERRRKRLKLVGRSKNGRLTGKAGQQLAQTWPQLKLRRQGGAFPNPPPVFRRPAINGCKPRRTNRRRPTPPHSALSAVKVPLRLMHGALVYLAELLEMESALVKNTKQQKR